MKRSILLLALALTGLGVAGSASAQSNLTLVTYEASFPLSDTKNFIDKTSFIGFGFEWRRFVQPNTSVGLSIALNVFDTKINDELISLEGVFDSDRNLDLWGTQYRYINSWPLMANAFYYMGDRRSSFRPYLGSGVGVYAARRRLDMGLNTLAETKWQFGLAPEVGFLYSMGELNLLVKGSYNYGLAAGEVNALSYFKVGVGLAWLTY